MNNNTTYVCDEERGFQAGFNAQEIEPIDKENPAFMESYKAGAHECIQGVLQFGSKEKLEEAMKKCGEISEKAIQFELKFVKDEKLKAEMLFKLKSAFAKGVVYGQHNVLKKFGLAKD